MDTQHELETIQDLIARKEYGSVYDRYAPLLRQMLFLDSLEEWLDFIGQEGALEETALRLYLSAQQGECLLLGGFHGEAVQAILDYLKPRLSAEAWERVSALNQPIVLDMDEAGGGLECQLVPYQEALAPFGYTFSIEFDDTYCAGAYFLALSS